MCFCYTCISLGVLRKAIPMNISIKKVCALVKCLCILHNFCINENSENTHNDNPTDESNNIVLPANNTDSTNILLLGGIGRSNIITGEIDEGNNIEDRLDDLLDGGNHFDDVNQYFRRQRMDEQNQSNFPRTKMFDKVIIQGYESRPHHRNY